MRRFSMVMILAVLLVVSLPGAVSAEWNAAQNKWIVGDNDAVFYSSPSCTGPQWLLMQGTQSYPILHNISSNGVKSWNNLIQCAEVGKNASAVGTCKHLCEVKDCYILKRFMSHHDSPNPAHILYAYA